MGLKGRRGTVVAICEEPGEMKIEEERRTEEWARIRKELSANGKTKATLALILNRSIGPSVWTGTGPKTENKNLQDRGPDQMASVRSGPVLTGFRVGPVLTE